MGYTKVLIIEADAERNSALQAVLNFVDCEPVVVSDCSQWQASIEDSSQFLAVLIGTSESKNVLESLLKDIHQLDEHLPIYLLAERGKEPTVAIDRGSCILGRIELPLRHTQLTTALHQAEVYRESQKPGDQRPVELFRSLVGTSRPIQKVRKMIEQVADSEATVLILGESGTGKEVVARNLHYYSARREQPFVPINCGAIPSELLESELFGHEKGAFTGAISARKGRFEMADGGTLFLDEIGDMSMSMQVKLLRVLQEKTFQRVGSNKELKANVRVVAATHRNLEQAILEKEFREDLFYRLNVFPIEMPPLRDRVEDISQLVNELIRRIEHEKRGSVRLTQASVMSLCQYDWPGNVRELANLVERMVILYPFGVVDVADLPEKFQIEGFPAGTKLNAKLNAKLNEGLVGEVVSDGQDARLPRDGIDLKEHLSNVELSFIRQALDDADGVVAHAAKRLGMRRTTLVEKLRKYGLQRGEEAAGA